MASTAQGDSMPDVLMVAQRLIGFPSPQTELLEAEPQVLRYLDECVVPLLGECGLPNRRDAMGNVIVEIGPSDPARELLIVGYAMTHPSAGMEDAFVPRVVATDDGPLLRGRGVCEQKGALAAAIVATARAARSPGLRGRLTLMVLTAGETGRHTAAAAAVGSGSVIPRWGIVAIGTSNRITLGNKGRIDVEVTVRGRSAHSGAPWMGLDAIAGAREVLERLDGLALPDEEHPHLGRVTLTPTALRSWPEATHTVQDLVRVVLDRRLLPGEDPDEAVAAIEGALRDVGPWEVEVSRGPTMLPSEVADDAEVVRGIRRGCERASIDAVETAFSHGGLDAGYLNSIGCETVMWGPGDPALWHTGDEQVAVADLDRAAVGYLGTILTLLNG